MGGIDLVDGTLHIDRQPNALDELAIRFTTILDDLGINHVYVSGYVAILTGRSRATEDIDVLVERVDDDRIAELAHRLDEADFWGPAMPLDRMAELLEEAIWVADNGEMVPHLEVKFVDDRFDRASLRNRITATIGGAGLPIGPLELQIAYKLWMGSQTDFEDALHLFDLFEESLSTSDLEEWVETLGVEDAYDRLKRT